MTNELTIHQHSIADIEKMALAVAKSGLFGMKTPDQAMALMLVSQAEGIHPMTAAMDYDIIQGRPAKKSQAMLKSFLANGGKVEWHERTDEKVEATFTHPQGGSVRIDWDIARAKKAGIVGKDNWGKFPRQMLTARCVSEGVRAVYPGATGGMYVPEEVAEFEKPAPMKDVTPPKQAKQIDDLVAEMEQLKKNEVSEAFEQSKPEPVPLTEFYTAMLERGKKAAADGNAALNEWYKPLSDEYKAAMNPYGQELRNIAKEADANKPTEEKPKPKGLQY